jgi:hypothetical protein
MFAAAHPVDEVLTSKEAADLLGIHRMSFERRIAKGDDVGPGFVPGRKAGHVWIVARRDVEALRAERERSGRLPVTKPADFPVSIRSILAKCDAIAADAEAGVGS